MGEELIIDPESTIIIEPGSMRGEILMNNHGMTGKGYKIKTTKPDEYTVRPTIGIIHPLQKAVIEVIVQPSTKVAFDHKFLIEIYNFDWRKGTDKFKEFIKETNEPPVIKKMLGIKMLDDGFNKITIRTGKVVEYFCFVVLFIQFFIVIIKMLF